MNRYPYEDHVLSSMSGESSREPGRQWSRDLGNNSGIRWRTYDNLPRDENIYDMHRQVPQLHLRQPGQSPQLRSYPQHFQMDLGMHHPTQQRFADDPAAAVAGPYLGPGSMPRPIYANEDRFDMYAQPPVLRQLFPSNEQTCNLASVQSGMRHGVATRGGSGSSLQSLATSLADLGPSTSQMRHPAAEGYPSSSDSRMIGVKRTGQAPSENTLQFTEKTSSVALAKRHRLESKNAPSPVSSEASPYKRTPVKIKTDVRQSEEKEIVAADTLEDKNLAKLQVDTRFITASVPDVLCWKQNDFFSYEERVSLLVEIVGTVFDIGGDKPVRISVHSQNSEMVGIFWETDRRLNRVALQPGTLVRVVLRIPAEKKEDFHFLSVRTLKARPGIESHYRRIAYICSNALGKQAQKH